MTIKEVVFAWRLTQAAIGAWKKFQVWRKKRHETRLIRFATRGCRHVGNSRHRVDSRLPWHLWALALMLCATVQAQQPTYTARQSWVAPTTTTAGTPLTNLAGYVAYKATVPTDITETQRLGVAQTEAVWTGLLYDVEYAFYVAASNTAGAIGPNSTVLWTNRPMPAFAPAEPGGHQIEVIEEIPGLRVSLWQLHRADSLAGRYIEQAADAIDDGNSRAAKRRIKDAASKRPEAEKLEASR